MIDQIDDLIVENTSSKMSYGPHTFPQTFAEQRENVAEHERLVSIAKASPEQHKISYLFEDEKYEFSFVDAGVNGRGWSVRFCWTTTRNVVGYFFTWRETQAPSHSRAEFTGLLNMYSASKRLEVCETRAKKRAMKFMNDASKKGAHT